MLWGEKRSLIVSFVSEIFTHSYTWSNVMNWSIKYGGVVSRFAFPSWFLIYQSSITMFIDNISVLFYCLECPH